MNYCSRCLYPSNHPYGIIFNENNLCSGCIIHEEKNEFDEDERYAHGLDGNNDNDS